MPGGTLSQQMRSTLQEWIQQEARRRERDWAQHEARLILNPFPGPRRPIEVPSISPEKFKRLAGLEPSAPKSALERVAGPDIF